MSVQPTVVKRFRFTDPNGRDAHCRIELVPASGGRGPADDRVVVIATELIDNPGMSVTNAVEALATQACEQFDLNPRSVVWIEFYGYPANEDPLAARPYDRVRFASVNSRGPLGHPSWSPMTDDAWRELGLEPRRDGIKFNLGMTVITANAKATLDPRDVTLSVYRHARGDWGDDLCEEDVRQNERALEGEGRLFSVYHDRNAVRHYVITECDRSATTVLLPEDY
jgi:hypothetical protein